MSDNRETEELDEAPSLDIDENVLDEARQEKIASGAIQHRRRSGAAGFFSLLALLLAAGGIAAGYYLYEREIKPLKKLPQVVSRLQQAGASKQDLSELQNQLQIVSAGNDSLQSELENAGGEYRSLQSGLAELRRTASWGQREWSLAEVGYLLNIANQQLQITRDPVTALAALNGAMRRLDTIAEPDLAPLRKQILLDIQAVENYQAPEPGAILADLVSASASIQPLPEPAAVVEQQRSSDDKPLQEKGLSDIWNTFKTSLVERVRVVRHEAPLNALTQQGVEAYKVDNLRLRIEILRLALLRLDIGAFQRELAALAGWVEQTLPAKQRAAILAEIDKLQHLDFAALPELHANVSGFFQQNAASPDAALEAVPETSVSTEPGSDLEAAMESAADVEAVPAAALETAREPDQQPAQPQQEQPVSTDTTATEQAATAEQPAASDQSSEVEQPESPAAAELEQLDRLLQQLDNESPQGAQQ